MPVEPPPSRWRFPDAAAADEHGVVGLGADLDPGTLLLAYRSGMFPMPLQGGAPMAWWSPDPRGIVPLRGVRISRSLRASCRRYEIRIDSSFAEVVAACADPVRPGGWITAEIGAAYQRLHELGWARCVEAWDDDGLAGGLYGVAIGGLFAGESMFHRRSDASKVAFVALTDLLGDDRPEERVLDVQWTTGHLASLGAVDIPRPEYLQRLGRALELPLPAPWR